MSTRSCSLMGGARAVTVRRLAADLKISTRTLYKRIGNRDNLIRNVVEL
jgi:AcrR family transcriptional regulator